MKVEPILDYVKHMQENYQQYLAVLEYDVEQNSYVWASESDNLSYEEISQIRSPSLELRDRISSEFEKLINCNGVYVGGLKKVINDKDGNAVRISVGPGETDSFGWLTGIIRITYKLGDRTMHDKVIFG